MKILAKALLEKRLSRLKNKFSNIRPSLIDPIARKFLNLPTFHSTYIPAVQV